MLREAAKPVSPDAIASTEVQDLIEQMVTVMSATGVGLAAPQIGVPLQIITLQVGNSLQGRVSLSKEWETLQRGGNTARLKLRLFDAQ